MPTSRVTGSTPLGEVLAARIRARGPISYAEWMGVALYEPGLGYYRRGRPTVGPEGDFLTSPEVHPIFGAALARVAVGVGAALGEPEPLRIVEVGPGSGCLAEALLEALPTAVELTLVEPDATAAAQQRERLARFAGRVVWQEEINAVSSGAHLVLANELLDAQPVHRLCFAGGEWRELLVDWSAETGFCDRAAPLSNASLANPFEDLEAVEGQLAEVSPARAEITAALGRLIGEGAMLLFDYGYTRHELYDQRRREGTLMTFRRHAPGEDPYAYPGEQDITCHIDIDQAMAAMAAAGLRAWPPRSQSEWLGEIGEWLLPPRREAAAHLAARRALEMLTDDGGLGRITLLAAARGPTEALAGLGEYRHS